jgi:hypothetical protein
MKSRINFDRLEVTALFVLIACIGCFMGAFLLFYPLFDKKSSLIQLNRPGQPVLMGALRMANTPVNSNAEKGVEEAGAPKKEALMSDGQKATSQAKEKESQFERSDLPPGTSGPENSAQRTFAAPPDYRNQRIARQSHESRLATQNHVMMDALAQQELQNLILQLPETDAYACIQTNNGIRCTASDPRGKYLEGLLSRAWGNPSCSAVTVGKRVGIAYSKCLPE